jgi:hypothetical protein
MELVTKRTCLKTKGVVSWSINHTTLMRSVKVFLEEMQVVNNQIYAPRKIFSLERLMLAIWLLGRV